MERPKVYCKNCKHSGAVYSDEENKWFRRDDCDHPFNFGSDHFSEDNFRKQFASEKNKDNHCCDFEAKE